MKQELFKNMGHVAQITFIVRSIEVFGHATIAVAEVKEKTAQFLKMISGTYYTFLPAHSINYVITRSAPNGQPDKSCTVGGLSDLNRYRWS